MLPGPRCYADHGGEGQGGQEGEEAEEEQALEAIIADASEGVQVVLAEEEGRALGVGGLSLEAPPPTPSLDLGSRPLPHPKHLVESLRVHVGDPNAMGLRGFTLRERGGHLLCGL